MGLDSYFGIRTDSGPHGPPPPVEWGDTPPQLVGGLFSGFGDHGSFRGKVYDDIVKTITGESLYQDIIPNDRVRAMADKLEHSHRFASDVPDDFPDLVRVFRAYADAGCDLFGWW